MTFFCPKCKYDIMCISNVKEVTVGNFKDVAHLQNIYEYGEIDEWLGLCDRCGYGWQAKSLSELVENLQTVGAIK